MTMPPVVREVRVPVEPAVAFTRFTAEMQSWWPRETHSVGRERCLEVRFGTGEGAVIEEVDASGERHVWGRVRVWDPPERVVFTWHPGRSEQEAQEVEITFRSDGSDTLVRLEHRGWEALGDAAEAVRADYEGGWQGVLALYRERVAATTDAEASAS